MERLRLFTKQNASRLIKYLDESVSTTDRLAVLEDFVLLQNPSYFPFRERKQFQSRGWTQFGVDTIREYFSDEISYAEAIQKQSYLAPLVEDLLEGTKYLVKTPEPRSGQALPFYVIPGADLSRGQFPGPGDLSTKVETSGFTRAPGIRISSETFWALVLAQPERLLENPAYKVAVLKKIQSFHLETIQERFFSFSWGRAFAHLATYGYLDSWGHSPRAVYLEKFGSRNLKYFEILPSEKVDHASVYFRGGGLPESVAYIVQKIFRTLGDEEPEFVAEREIKLIDAPEEEPLPQPLSDNAWLKERNIFCQGLMGTVSSRFLEWTRYDGATWWQGDRYVESRPIYNSQTQNLHARIYVHPDRDAEISVSPSVSRIQALGGHIYEGMIPLKNCEWQPPTGDPDQSMGRGNVF